MVGMGGVRWWDGRGEVVGMGGAFVLSIALTCQPVM